MKTSISPSPPDAKEELRELLWVLLRRRLERASRHEFVSGAGGLCLTCGRVDREPVELWIHSRAHRWERFNTFFHRCSICGWGWKLGVDNDFPCPGGPERWDTSPLNPERRLD